MFYISNTHWKLIIDHANIQKTIGSYDRLFDSGYTLIRIHLTNTLKCTWMRRSHIHHPIAFVAKLSLGSTEPTLYVVTPL